MLVFAGIILRVMVAFSLVSNVVVPWALSCLVFDFITAAQVNMLIPLLRFIIGPKQLLPLRHYRLCKLSYGTGVA